MAGISLVFWGFPVNRRLQSSHKKHSTMRSVNRYATAFVALAASATAAGSLKDIKHIVLFMQENRSFNHVTIPFSGVWLNSDQDEIVVLWHYGRHSQLC